MNNREKLEVSHDILQPHNFLDDFFDEAIMGIDDQTLRVVYDCSECISLMMKHTGEDLESTKEDFCYNYSNAHWAGSPLYVWSIKDENYSCL